MPKTDFIQYVVEDLLSEMSGVTHRAMFGGYGVYKDGVIFAIVADDALYFKVDGTNRKEYEAAGSRPFTYIAAKRKRVALSYWEVPAEVLDDREKIAEWAGKSLRINSRVR